MLTERPKIKRILVTARDMDTGKSKSTTVYETTPEWVIGQVKRPASAAVGNQPVTSNDARNPAA